VKESLFSQGMAGGRGGVAWAPHLFEPDVGPLHRAQLLRRIETIGIEGVPEANRRQVALRHDPHGADTVTSQGVRR